jgi:hypothetical protein
LSATCCSTPCCASVLPPERLQAVKPTAVTETKAIRGLDRLRIVPLF